MQTTTNETTATTDGILSNPVLLQHDSRPDWGLAIVAWQRGDKRGYQFEDGELRVFKKGYFKLLVPVDRPVDESRRALATLGKLVGRERAAKRIGADRPMISLADQIAYFAAQFPKGFQGVKWAKQHRGLDVRTQLKRHRNQVLQRAAQLLAPTRLDAHLDRGQADVIVGELRDLLESTDLATKASMRGIDRVDSVAAEQLVRALSALLTDGSEVTSSFDGWVVALKRALHREPTWELATALPALARSDRFTAVKKTTFTSAAAWMAPNVIIEAPSGPLYQRLLDMTELLTTKLGEAGLRPRDRMDVYDFIQVTLRPKAIREITANREPVDAAPETVVPEAVAPGTVVPGTVVPEAVHAAPEAMAAEHAAA